MYSNYSRRSFGRRALALLLGPIALPVLGSNSQDSQSQGAKNAQEGDKDAKKSTGDKDKDEDKVYVPGGDVKAPKLTHYVEPEFSSSSSEAFVDGIVKIEAVVTTDGLPINLKILSGLNTQEDKTAMEAVKQWRFRPGTKGDQPVKVKVTVEVNFHLL